MRSFKKELKKLYAANTDYEIIERFYSNDSNCVRYTIKNKHDYIIEDFEIDYCESIDLYFVGLPYRKIDHYNTCLNIVNHLLPFIKGGKKHKFSDGAFEIKI